MAADVIDVAVPVLPVIGTNDESVRNARRAFNLHRRRARTSRCALCGFRWGVGDTTSGKPAVGCFRRRQAIELLDVAGLYEPSGSTSP
ncbi:MAG: hypothetical protein ACRDT4_11105 [Micromonosporaceae bacterium]